jgi:AraC-like DNA-binding protein
MQPFSTQFTCATFTTSDAGQLEHRLKAQFDVAEFDLPDPAGLRFSSNMACLHDLSLSHWTFGTQVLIKFRETPFAALGLPLKGHGVTSNGTRTVPINAGTPVTVSAGQAATFQYDADLQKRVLLIKPEALKRKLSVLLGATVSRGIEFDPTEFVSREMLAGLLGLIESLAACFDDRHSYLTPLAIRQFEKAVIIQLLLTTRHQFTHQLHRTPAETSPEHVKRAEEFIEANWNQPITMESLTQVTGVSARTLFRTFEKLRGYSPMAFVKKVRLDRAHAALSKPNDLTTVTGVALAHGFLNPGRFAHDYWTMFGELPSETLNRVYRTDIKPVLET